MVEEVDLDIGLVLAGREVVSMGGRGVCEGLLWLPLMSLDK